MDSWRGQKGYNRHQATPGNRSFGRKPSLARNWRLAVPSWEKEFCRLVGSVPWKKFLEAKRYIHLHKKVLEWNDSAVEKAFYNAKVRFWAEINGVPCSITLPDPNLYMDEVDWESEVDPQLLGALDRETLDGGNNSGTTMLGDVPANSKEGRTFESTPDMVCDNWDTWDWGDPNRELEPPRPYVARHKSSRFRWNDQRMGHGWNRRRG